RDIKPANVLLNKDGLPKLTDFGLAKAEATDHGMTMTGAVMGTPDFMPPEQRRDASEVDARSDLWSLAATVYQMVTGRSPKVIAVRHVPDSLQDVLTRALEDRKDLRYQTARELRDALKGVGASKAKSAVVPDELQEGQCKACGTVTSDLTKKFCRNPKCGASLRVACLKCDAQIPVWDGVCGECGGNQPALLDEKRRVLVAKRAEAESLLGLLAFDQALARAAELAEEAHPDLAEFSEWGASFSASTTAERDRQSAIAAENLAEAQAHVAAWDYPAAIHAIESIPEPLRDAAATAHLRECQEKKEESESLIATIAERITRKEIDGLMPLVRRAVSLRGDRQDLAKIHGQLLERRDTRLSKARAAMDAGDVPAAAAALAKAAMEDYSGDDQEFITRVRRALALENEIVQLVKEARADSRVTPEEAMGILKVGREYLALNPKNEKIGSLVKQSEQIAEPLLREGVLALPPIRNSIGIELKLLPAGTFTMGQAGGDSDETPHRVTLTQPFYIGVYEVTNAQWKRVMGSVPSNWKDDDRPVEQVSWDDAVEFCKKLSELPEERRAGRVYRLPTEAEWEYACRAGSTTQYSFGDDESQLGEHGWFEDNSGGQTHPVGQKRPNDWGLYDMHGNVWEWCSDWYGDYPKGAVTDPQGPASASGRVARGGSWGRTAWFCRSASRYGLVQSNRYLGFRLALSSSGAEPVPPEAATGK
ncbi:MAG: bifunctional serine/threonine-protein kinase/formylglycine-generating enzyme family protein, partial [Candidatus Kapaibacterium sp.]